MLQDLELARPRLALTTDRNRSKACGVLMLVSAASIVAGASISILYYISISNSISVNYILPSDFRGPFRIEFAEPGLAITPTSRLPVDLKIPSSRILVLRRSDRFYFENWHTESAEFVNGGRVKMGYDVAHDDDDSIALWSLWTDDQGNIWMFVGTRAEMLDATQELKKLGSGRAVRPDEELSRPEIVP